MFLLLAHLHEIHPPHVRIWMHHLLQETASVIAICGGFEQGWRGIVVGGIVSCNAQERELSCHD
jgi:hypothetical protein